MADSAFLTTAFAKVGFSGDYGGSYFLTRLVGAAKAREMYLLPERIDAAQARALGGWQGAWWFGFVWLRGVLVALSSWSVTV